MGSTKQQTPNLIGIRVEPLKSRIGAAKYIKSDWTMTAFVLPRSSLGLTFADKELQYNSIYFLFGYDGPTEKVYVGQAKKRNGGGSVLLRLREHDKSTTEPYRDIWQYVIVITSVNDDWGPTELNNLEHLFYQEIPAKNNLNGNNPNFGGIDQDTDYSEKIRQAKTYIRAIGLQIFDDTDETEKIQVESVINDYSTVEDLQNGMARIPEIITPQRVVKSMIDMLPKELFNPDTTFLDLACKGGEYLRELYDRLMETESLIAKYNDSVERSNHILSKQLFGIALSQVSLDRTAKSLKGFDHNIKVIPSYISYIKDKKDETGQFKAIINRELGQMKFDVVIGNPPYQEATASIYQHFINKAIDLQPKHIAMIVKNNWMASDTLKETREKMINAGLKTITNYPIVGEMFPSIGVAVNIFHIDRDHKGIVKITDIQKGQTVSEFECDLKDLPIIPISQMDYNIIHKVTKDMKESFSKEVYPCECFRVNSNMTVGRGEHKYGLDYSVLQTEDFSIAVACMANGALGYNYINRDDVPAKADLINTYKIISGARLNHNQNVITSIYGLSPGSICNASFVPLYTNENKEMAYGAYTYIRTRFFRFLVRLLCDDGMTNMSPYRFSLVPMQDFTKTWSDEELYAKYNLTKEEIAYIEAIIKPMD